MPSQTAFYPHTPLFKRFRISKQLQQVTGFTPIWHNNHYPELAKLQEAPRWRKWGITHLYHIFQNGCLCSVEELRTRLCLPKSMYFYYVQLKHAVTAQGSAVESQQSPTPVFNMMAESVSTKGFISRC